MTTLFDIYDAAFDDACNYAEETIEYIIQYADGALDINLTDDQAQIILDALDNWKKADEARGTYSTSHDFFVHVEEPLKAIEV